MGDDAVEFEGRVVAVVERKKLQELAGNVVDLSLLLRLAELSSVPRAAVVVADRWTDVLRLRHAAPPMVAVARFLAAAVAFAAEEAVGGLGAGWARWPVRLTGERTFDYALWCWRARSFGCL